MITLSTTGTSNMTQAKIGLGMLTTGSAALASWMETFNDVGQLVVTILGIVVGVLTAWYSYEKARKMRTERLNGQREKD